MPLPALTEYSYCCRSKKNTSLKFNWQNFGGGKHVQLMLICPAPGPPVDRTLILINACKHVHVAMHKYS